MNGGLKAVILIGGPHIGTRFRPLSFEVSKPLFPIAGFPMIQHHVEACNKLPDIREILVIGFYPKTRELSRILADLQKKHKRTIRYLQEHCALGTGGGLYHFRDQILSGSPSAFFLINGDVCCDFPVAEMYHFQKETGGCIILGTKANESQAVHYGCIVENPETHQVLHYVEKPETFVSDLINAGAYLFTKDIFGLLGQELKKNYEETNGNAHDSCDAIDLERTILKKLSNTGKLFLYMNKGFWSQFKTAGNAIYANKLYLSLYRHNHKLERLVSTIFDDTSIPSVLGDVRIDPSSTVHPTAVLGPNVYVGAGVTIGAGTRIKEAIILDRAEIKVIIITLVIIHTVMAKTNYDTNECLVSFIM
jgi:mannose-1-phosphate guanylyltransferase